MFHHPPTWDMDPNQSCSPVGVLRQAHARARFSHRVEREDFDEAMRLMKASKVSKTKQNEVNEVNETTLGMTPLLMLLGGFLFDVNGVHLLVVSNILYFHHYLGKWSSLTHIFQMGWNHHLAGNDAVVCFFCEWLMACIFWMASIIIIILFICTK